MQLWEFIDQGTEEICNPVQIKPPSKGFATVFHIFCGPTLLISQL